MSFHMQISQMNQPGFIQLCNTCGASLESSQIWPRVVEEKPRELECGPNGYVSAFLHTSFSCAASYQTFHITSRQIKLELT